MAVDFRPLVAPTDDELMRLHGLNPGYSVERHADGTLLVSPNGGKGTVRNSALLRAVFRWQARTEDEGLVTESSGGYRLPNSAVYAPDAGYIRRERWSAIPDADREAYIHGAPDAAFELVAQSDTVRTQRAKCEKYVSAGSGLVVLIDPYRRRVIRWLSGIAEESADPHAVDCGPVMPGFILDAAALFDL